MRRAFISWRMLKAKPQSKPEAVNARLAKKKGPVSRFLAHNYRHFNAAALLDAAQGYEAHLAAGGKMLVTLAGAMSTAELGISLAEMIRRDKVHAIVCTGANLEEDIFNLVAHDFYERVPHYRDLTPADEQVIGVARAATVLLSMPNEVVWVAEVPSVTGRVPAKPVAATGVEVPDSLALLMKLSPAAIGSPASAPPV